MDSPVRILGLAGSWQRPSYNRAALRTAAQLTTKGIGASIQMRNKPGAPSSAVRLRFAAKVDQTPDATNTRF
jgi:NAD(P)H-dependent FMN reductase